MSTIEQEAAHYNKHDMKDRRAVSWSRFAAPYLRKALYGASDRDKFLLNLTMKGKKKKGLTLACGDMRAEAKYFKLLNVRDIDAYDVSEATLLRAKEHCSKLDLDVNLCLEDVNSIKLPKKRYDLIVLCHAYHHLENIEYIGSQLAASLKDDGVFLLLDYIGPRYIQFTDQQLHHANIILKSIPKKLRYDRKGDLIDKIYPPLRWGLSAHEAIESPKILPTVESNFVCIKGMLYGGLMHPVLERIAGNFNIEDSEHEKILHNMWCTEVSLISECSIEPNFCELILVKKDSSLLDFHAGINLVYKKLSSDERYEHMVQTASQEIWRLKNLVDGLRNAVSKREDRISKLLSSLKL